MWTHHVSLTPHVHSFIHSFIHSLIRSFIHAFVHSFIHSFIHFFYATCASHNVSCGLLLLLPAGFLPSFLDNCMWVAAALQQYSDSSSGSSSSSTSTTQQHSSSSSNANSSEPSSKPPPPAATAAAERFRLASLLADALTLVWSQLVQFAPRDGELLRLLLQRGAALPVAALRLPQHPNSAQLLASCAAAAAAEEDDDVSNGEELYLSFRKHAFGKASGAASALELVAQVCFEDDGAYNDVLAPQAQAWLNSDVQRLLFHELACAAQQLHGLQEQAAARSSGASCCKRQQQQQ
jgi:hypothetical protein